jgi:hypothetical protein
VRTCFYQFLSSLETPVGEDLPFAVGRPRDDTQPPQVVTLREFDELTAHSGWLRTLYMLQPYPERLFNYTGLMVGKGKSVKALSDMLAAQVARTDAHYQVSAVTVRAAAFPSAGVGVGAGAGAGARAGAGAGAGAGAAHSHALCRTRCGCAVLSRAVLAWIPLPLLQSTLSVVTKRLARFLRRSSRRTRRRPAGGVAPVGSSGAGKKREGPTALPPPPVRPYDVGGGDLSDSSGVSDGGVDVVDDTTHHRIQALTGHYFVDTSGSVWLSHVSAVITQLVTVRPDPRMIMSTKIASRVAKTVRG